MSTTVEQLRGKGFVEQADGTFAKARSGCDCQSLSGTAHRTDCIAGVRVSDRNHLVKDPTPRTGVRHEMDLHDDIMAWCDEQWPRLKYIRARSDQRSTIAAGAPDFTIFLPGGRVLCCECKSKDGKLTTEQSAWAKEMEMLGHKVHVVRHMVEFLDIVAHL